MNNDIFFPTDKLIYEDYFFMNLVMMHGKRFYIINDKLYFWRIHNDGTFLKKNQLYHLDKLRICEMLLGEYSKRMEMKSFYSIIESWFVKEYYLGGIHIIFTRFDDILFDVISLMKNTVKEKFPGYENNEWLNNEIVKEHILQIGGNAKIKILRSLNEEFTHDEWKRLKITYLESVKKDFLNP